MIFSKITKLLNKKNIIYTLFFLSIFFIFSDVSFAEVGDTSGSEIVVGATQFLFKIVASLIGVLTALVSIFLHPGWYSGEIFNLTYYLKEIWILVSNVVYFIFAFILIWIAFMNIINKGGDKYQLKSALPKFIIGVLIVPFSWFFVQFVLSISAILTVSVLTLPYDTFGSSDFFKQGGKVSETKLCTEYEINLGTTKNTQQPTTSSTEEPSYDIGDSLICDKESIKTLGNLFNGTDGEDGFKNSIFGLISIYTYGVMHIEQLDDLEKLDLTGEGAISELLDLGLKAIFDVIFIVIYLILMIALFLALFTRGVWLWIYTMLSPVFGLMYFFDKTSEGVGGDTKFSIKEFIGLAMIPVYVSAALSFGLLFLFVASTGLEKSSKDPDSGSSIFIVDKEQNATIDIGGFKFKIKGSFAGNSGKGTEKTSGGEAKGGIFDGVGSALGKLIIEMFGLVILWIAVMTALKGSDTTEKIIQPIAEFGKSVGTLIAKSPQYSPIIPTGKGITSATGLGRIGQDFKTHYESSASRKGSDIANKFINTGDLAKINTELIAAKNALPDDIKNGRLAEAIRKAIVASKGDANSLFDSDLRKVILKDIQDNKLFNDVFKGININSKMGFAQALDILQEKVPQHRFMGGVPDKRDIQSWQDFEKALKEPVQPSNDDVNQSNNNIKIIRTSNSNDIIRLDLGLNKVVQFKRGNNGNISEVEFSSEGEKEKAQNYFVGKFAKDIESQINDKDIYEKLLELAGMKEEDGKLVLN